MKMATRISAALLGLTLFLAAVSIRLDPRPYHISVGNHFHLSVQDGCLLIFNDANYGPYNGSIIDVSSAEEKEPAGAILEKNGFGDSVILYYRYYRTDQWTLWTLSVSLLYPMALFAMLPVIWSIRALVRRRREKANG
jgi:hypothetical protein